MRRVQISCDICTRFARHLYSTKQCWIIKGNIYLSMCFEILKLHLIYLQVLEIIPILEKIWRKVSNIV